MNEAQLRPRGRGGFTLIEIGVVLAIVAVVTAVAVPALRLPDDEPISPVDAVLAVVRTVRTDALRRGMPMEMVIDSRSDRYWIGDADGMQATSSRFGFDEGVTWSAASPRLRLRFTRSGGVAGERLRLVHPDGRTDQIDWKRWSGSVRVDTESRENTSSRGGTAR